MSFDDVISSGGAFLKSLKKAAGSKGGIYATILGIGGGGAAWMGNIQSHLNNIESIPEYRQKVDSAITRMDSTTTEIRRSVVPLLIMTDSLPAMVKHANDIEYRVNENMDLIDMMYEDFYDYKYDSEMRIKHLEDVTH